MDEAAGNDGSLLWEPTEASVARAGITRYLAWLHDEQGLAFDDYAALWEWSVSDLDAFWGSIWDYFAINAQSPYQAVLGSRAMPGAQWFPGATLNYAEHALRRNDDAPAIIAADETGDTVRISFSELRDQVALRPPACGAWGLGRETGSRPCFPISPKH